VNLLPTLARDRVSLRYCVVTGCAVTPVAAHPASYLSARPHQVTPPFGRSILSRHNFTGEYELAKTANRSRTRREPDWPIPIDELAQRVGMSPRNIRAHQSRGLLPAPERRGRVACYGREHERILLRIRELQERGYNLTAINEMLHAGGDDLMMLQRLVLAPLLEADEIVVSREEIGDMFGVKRHRGRLKQALDSGLLVDLGDDRFLMPSRNVLEAARRLTEMGMPVLELYEMQLTVVTATADLARRFVEASLRCALEPYDGELAPERWDEVRTRFDELRRLTASMLAATFTMNVRRATERLIADEGLPSRPASGVSSSRP